jgi:transketolase C-terminal domain/subunit
LFRYRQSIIHFDPEIPDRAFDLGVAEQKLDSPKVARAPVNQGSFRAS